MLLLGGPDRLGRLGPGRPEHFLGRGVRVRPDLLGVGEHGVSVGVGVLAERLDLLLAWARTAAASSSAEIRSSSAARTVSSAAVQRQGRDGQQPQGHRARGREPAVGLEAGLGTQSLGLLPGGGQPLLGDSPGALTGLGGLREDLAPLRLGRLEQHPDLLARVRDGMACLVRGIGEPCLGLRERAGRRLTVGRGLVVQSPGSAPSTCARAVASWACCSAWERSSSATVWACRRS